MTGEDAGGVESLEDLYRRVVPMFVRRAREAVGEDAAKSVAHDAFLKAYKKFDPVQGVKFTTFMARIFHGELVDEIRRRARMPRVVTLVDSVATPDEQGDGSASTMPDIADLVAGASRVAEIIRRLRAKIDDRYKGNELLRGRHYAVLRYTVLTEFAPESVMSDQLQDLAAELGVAPTVIAQTRARIRLMLLEVLNEKSTEDE